MFKSRVIKWAIKQIVKDGSGTYGDMRYLEDVMENEWGEKMFIFSHRLVPVNKVKLDAANAASRLKALSDPNAPQQADPSVTTAVSTDRKLSLGEQENAKNFKNQER